MGPFHVARERGALQPPLTQLLWNPGSSCVFSTLTPRRNIVFSRRILLLVALLLAAAAFRFTSGVSAGDEWQPVSPEELKMTSEPRAPGAPAITLYRQVDRDDSDPMRPHEYNYVRTKILTEEGRKYADVEIPVIKGR